MLDDMRKYVRAGIEALSGQGPDEVAGALMMRAQAAAEQLSGLAAGFLEWSTEARASILREVKDIVARQVQEMGLVTKQELDPLEARVVALESAVGNTARKPTPRKPTAKKATAKKATAKKATAKKSTAARARSGTSAARSGSPPSRSGSGSR